jgi:hypothetical protein
MFLKCQFVCHHPLGYPDCPKPVAPVMVMPGISRCSGTSGRPTRRMTPARNSLSFDELNVCVWLMFPKWVVLGVGRLKAGRIPPVIA